MGMGNCKCQYCSRTFKSNSILSTHLMQEHGKTLKDNLVKRLTGIDSLAEFNTSDKYLCPVCRTGHRKIKFYSPYGITKFCSKSCATKSINEKYKSTHGISLAAKGWITKWKNPEKVHEVAVRARAKADENRMKKYGESHPFAPYSKEDRSKFITKSSAKRSQTYHENHAKGLHKCAHNSPFSYMTPEQRSAAISKGNCTKIQNGTHPWMNRIHSKFELSIYEYIKNKGFNAKLNGLRIKNHNYDIYLPDFKTVIECDGFYYHHEKFGLDKDTFNAADSKVNQMAIHNGYNLVRISDLDCNPYYGKGVELLDKLIENNFIPPLDSPFKFYGGVS